MTWKKTIVLVVVLVIFGGCDESRPSCEDSGYQAPSTSAEEPVEVALAEVNGIPIGRDYFLKQIEPYPARMKESIQGRESVLQTLIDQTLLESEAKRLGLDRDSDFLRKVDSCRLNLLNTMLLEKISEGGSEVTEQQVKEYFDAHPEEFDHPERVQARHILLTTEQEAKEVLEKIRAGSSFEQMAKEFSKDEYTKDRGGDLGVFSRQQRPDLADAAFSLARPGKIAGPVKTQSGFHLVQLVQRFPAEKESFDKAYQNLVSRLRAEKRQEARNQLVDRLRETAEIEIDEEALEALEIPLGE